MALLASFAPQPPPSWNSSTHIMTLRGYPIPRLPSPLLQNPYLGTQYFFDRIICIGHHAFLDLSYLYETLTLWRTYLSPTSQSRTLRYITIEVPRTITQATVREYDEVASRAGLLLFSINGFAWDSFMSYLPREIDGAIRQIRRVGRFVRRTDHATGHKIQWRAQRETNRLRAAARTFRNTRQTHGFIEIGRQWVWQSPKIYLTFIC